jgi:phosphonate transport system substrate-binding protein
MFGNFVTKIAWMGILAALVGCSAKSSAPPLQKPTPTSSATATGTIVLAEISDEPTKKINRFQPLADYLATNLKDVGIGIGEVKIAPDMETMAKWLASGEVDIFFDSPYPAMIVSDRSSAKPLLRRWKDGTADYHTIIFTRSNRGFKKLSDLKGQMIAFEESFSTSGYMLPLTHLLKTGLNPIEKQDVNAQVGKNEVGYVFSENDQNAIQWVLSNRIAAAAVGSTDFLEIPPETRNQLTVLAKTESLPRHLVIVSPKMDLAKQKAIKTVLVNMDETQQGRVVLKKFEKTSQFDEFPEGSDASLARMRELYNLVKNR